LSEPAKVGRIDDTDLVPFVPESRDTFGGISYKKGTSSIEPKSASSLFNEIKAGEKHVDRVRQPVAGINRILVI